MLEIIIKFVATIIILVGVILVYDARTITSKLFGFGDQNEGAEGLKILGGISAVIGIVIMFLA